MKYIIGTRGSRLALVQAEYIRDMLFAAYPEDEFEIKTISTKGDIVQDKSLSQLGSQGVFIREIEEEILCGKVDIGVHSMKDMPSETAAGLIFTRPVKREDPRDVLVLREAASLAELPQNAVIGTGSKRRGLQLLKKRPDLQITDIRGNVETRLRKLTEQKLDGIVLAAAGLKRLGLAERITEYLDPEDMIPAPAQGILALEIRESEAALSEKLNRLCDPETEQEMAAERGFLKGIGGDCNLPVAASCMPDEKYGWVLRCMFGNESGSRLAYASVSGSDPVELACEAVRTIRGRLAGKVLLVGAGPGDAGLITVRGQRAIREADCIVYDRLASPKLLEEAKPDCEKIYVGKENHHHTLRQEEINSLLVKKAMEYDSVVRLKGGDVYVFGRGGEEGLYLYENGVSFEVIPGISSSMAGLAYAGIPITHRGIATGFHVMTAHNKKDEAADLDYKGMAQGRDTCVFLMGLTELPGITKKLLEAGMAPNTPAAVISCATTGRQKTCTAALFDIVSEAERAEIVSPALIVVGEVVTLREKLNFFEKRPLFGKKFLIPRIGDKATGLAQLLEECGAQIEEIQVGTIRQCGIQLQKEELCRVNWIIFTSKNGVDSFFKDVFEKGFDIRTFSGVRFAVIGTQTAETLRGYGIISDLMPRQYTGAALAEELSKQFRKEDAVLYLKAGNADESMRDALADKCCFKEYTVYENEAAAVGTLPSAPEEYDGIFITCASSAERLMTIFAGDPPEKWYADDYFFSIGPKSSECIRRLGFHGIVEAKEATYKGLAAAAEEYFTEKIHG